MSIAVIKTGGKQYKVSEGQTIKIEKIKDLEDTKVIFDNVLLLASDDEKEVRLGTPIIESVKVSGEVVEEARDQKVRVAKYKNKTRYHKVQGHRQAFMKVKILEIK
jgi:large subunit ribosomal protein L21